MINEYGLQLEHTAHFKVTLPGAKCRHINQPLEHRPSKSNDLDVSLNIELWAPASKCDRYLGTCSRLEKHRLVILIKLGV
jgi:hypothetical protein